LLGYKLVPLSVFSPQQQTNLITTSTFFTAHLENVS